MIAAYSPKRLGPAFTCLAIFIGTVDTTSCSPEILNTTSQLMQDLNTLEQNRTLAEQFVRDIKANVDPSEPMYPRLLESYDQARDSYNRFLDEIEAPGSHRARAIHTRFEAAKRNAEDSMTAFLDSATRTLRPTLSMRSTELKRVTALPDNLVTILQTIPKAERETYSREFDTAVRWRSWNEL